MGGFADRPPTIMRDPSILVAVIGTLLACPIQMGRHFLIMIA